MRHPQTWPGKYGRVRAAQALRQLAAQALGLRAQEADILAARLDLFGDVAHLLGDLLEVDPVEEVLRIYEFGGCEIARGQVRWNPHAEDTRTARATSAPR